MTGRSIIVALLWVLVPLGMLFAGSAFLPAAFPPPAGAFDIRAEVSPLALRSGQEALVAVVLRNRSEGAFTDVIVDVEVHQGDRMVFQGYFEGRQFGTGGSPSAEQRVEVRWTPAAVATYVLKVGVFSKDWSGRHEWSDDVARLAVRSAKNG